MTTLIEVLDTAIKIGLGALISGVVTYWVTQANYKNTLRKEAAEGKRKTIREIAELIEESASLLNEFIHSHWGGDRLEANKRMAEKLENLIRSYQSSSRAHTLANLIGSSSLTIAIDDFSNTIDEFRELISSDLSGFNEAEGNRIIAKINKCKHAIEPLISQAFTATYA